MKPKYKVGDKVVIVKRIGDSTDYPCSFIDEMTKFSGELCTIKSVECYCRNYTKSNCYEYPSDGYVYKLKEHSFRWSSSMFSTNKISNKKCIKLNFSL